MRTAELLEHLFELADVDVHVRGEAPKAAFPGSFLARVRSWRHLSTDAGVVQSGEFLVDLEATRAKLATWDRVYPREVEKEAVWLAENADFVLGDVPPLAFDAAATAGLPAVALANFSWDWIYARLGLDQASQTAANAYAREVLLLELEPSCPMPAFTRRERLGLLGRRCRRARDTIRDSLGIGEGERMVLIAIRDAQGSQCRLPPPMSGVVYMAPEAAIAERRDDVLKADPHSPFIEFVAAADAAVIKPGYGILGDTAACGTPVIYSPRSGFPEDEVLVGALSRRSCSARVETDDLKSGQWGPLLLKVLAQTRPLPEKTTAAAKGAAILAKVMGE